MMQASWKYLLKKQNDLNTLADDSAAYNGWHKCCKQF